MSWLNPGLLWLAALAAVPLILHILLRERLTRVLFPSLRFLKGEGRQLLTRRRWLENLLLALRIACVLLLIAAFARPLVGGGSGPTGTSQHEVVILLDVSRSMTIGKRMEDARREAEAVLAKSPGGALLAVATFADVGSAAVGAAKDRDDAAAMIARAAPTGAGTDALAALDRAIDSVRGSTGEIHLISDLQAIGFPRTHEPRHPPTGWTVRVHKVGGGDVQTDGAVAISGGSFPAEITPSERNLAVTARIANSGPERTVDAKLIVDGKELDRRTVHLPQDGEAVASLVGTVRAAGDHPASVSLLAAPIALPGDDSFSFVARVVDKVRVAVLDGNPSDDSASDSAYYVGMALNSGAESPYAAEIERSLGDLKGRDVAVLTAVESLGADDAKRLDAFVRAGGGLLIGLGPGIDPARFNAALGSLLPARMRAWSEGSHYLVAADATHPLVAALIGDGKSDLGAARFSGAADVMDSQDAHVVMRFDDERPALIEARRGAGTVLLFTGCLDRRASYFPLHPLFVPFIRESLRQLASRTQRSRSLAAGETVAVPAGATVVDPAGHERAVAAPTAVSLGQPGIWTVRSAAGPGPGDGAITLYAVNADARESQLAALEVAEVEKLVTAPTQVQVRAVGRGLERVLMPDEKLAAERRWNLGWWFLIALAALLPIELRLAQAASRT